LIKEKINTVCKIYNINYLNLQQKPQADLTEAKPALSNLVRTAVFYFIK